MSADQRHVTVALFSRLHTAANLDANASPSAIIVNILSIVKRLRMIIYNKFSERLLYMITFTPLWKTLNQKNMSTYDLIYKHGLSANTIHRMKKNEAITTKTLNELCFILKCPVSCIIEYEESEND